MRGRWREAGEGAILPRMANPLKELRRAAAWHEERHRPSGFDFALSDSIDYLDGGAWDALTAGGSFFLQKPYLRALEATAPSNLKPRFALVFRGRTPLAAVVMQLVEIGAERVVAKGRPAAKALSKLSARALVCGNLFSWGPHGFAFARDADPAAVWPGVADALYRLRQAEKLSGKTDLVLVKDLFDGESAGVEALKRFSYNPLDTDPNMVLQLDPAWKSFDDYLAGLHSKYRKNAARIVRDLEAAGCRLEPLGRWEREAAAVHRLYLEVHQAAAVRPVTLTPDYFPALAEAAGDRLRTTVVRRGDELLGFVTTIKEDDTTAIGYFIGFRRELKQDLPLYFALLQAVVADAIALGCRRLSFGRTALEPKAKLGARPVPTKIWVRHSNPLLNIAVKSLLGAVPHDEAPDRNPFKEPAA